MNCFVLVSVGCVPVGIRGAAMGVGGNEETIEFEQVQ